tara:strand:- start:1043 stop:1540 length:498 start_codon:yes stop_codon:yes gene_type:complete
MTIPDKFPPALYETYLVKDYAYDNNLSFSAGGCSGRDTKVSNVITLWNRHPIYESMMDTLNVFEDITKHIETNYSQFGKNLPTDGTAEYKGGGLIDKDGNWIDEENWCIHLSADRNHYYYKWWCSDESVLEKIVRDSLKIMKRRKFKQDANYLSYESSLTIGGAK